MKKHKQRKRKAPGPAQATEDVAHLDEALTDITTTTAVSLKKHWKPLAVGGGAVALVIILYVGMQVVERDRNENIQAKFYRLYTAPVAGEEQPDTDGLRSLLGEVEGTECEKYMIKQWAAYQLDRADELAREAEDSPDEGSLANSSNAEPKKLRDNAVTLARDLASRYPDSEELQKWKKSVEDKVAAMSKVGWLPPPRKYQPPKISSP